MSTGWEVIYDEPNGESHKQFQEEKPEMLFKDIDQTRLFEFRLYHNGKIISLFPSTGTFGLNGLIHNTHLSKKELQYRLIYFTRRQKSIGVQPKNINNHMLGFQVNIEGKNHKKIISICNNKIQFV